MKTRGSPATTMRSIFVVFATIAALCTGPAATAAESPAQAEAIFSFAAVESNAAATSSLVGRMAPDFVLPDDAKNLIRLSELRGKWIVLHLYPFYDTPDCTCRANEFTTQLQRFDDFGGAVAYGITTSTPEQLRHVRKIYGLKLTLLSDPEKQVLKAYGAWAEAAAAGATYGRVVRATFVIAPDGRIRRHWPEVMPEGHAERVRAYVQHETVVAVQDSNRKSPSDDR